MESTNPYQAPDADLDQTPQLNEFDQTGPFDPKGRFGRLSYMAWSLLALAANWLISTVMSVGIATSPEMAQPGAASYLMIGVVMLLALAMLVVGVIFAIRRVHDFNASGWWLLLMIVPVVNLILALVLWLVPGSDGSNDYGPTRLTPTWEKIVGVLFPLVLLLTLLAVAIPAYNSYLEAARQAAGG